MAHPPRATIRGHFADVDYPQIECARRLTLMDASH